MKSLYKFLGLITIITLFNACSKNSDPVTPVVTYDMRLNYNSTPLVFNNSVTFVEQSTVYGNATYIKGDNKLNGVESAISFSIRILSDLSTIKAGDTFANGESMLIFLPDTTASTTYYSNSVSQPTVTITAVGTKYIKGTFSGAVYDYNYPNGPHSINPAYTITNGSFTATN
jgi:hypothetical protein